MNQKDLHQRLTELMGEQDTSLSFDRVWKAYKKPAKKKWMLRTAVAVAGITTIGFTSAAFVSPSFASILQKLPFLSSIYEQPGILSDRGWEQVDRQALATDVEKTVKDKGITVKVTDVFYDGVRLALGYDLLIPEEMNEDNQLQVIAKSEIRGVKTDFMMTDSTNQKVDANLYRGGITINTSTLPESFTLDLKIEQIGEKEGSWKFAIPVSMTAEVKTFEPRVEAVYKDFQLRVKKVTASPASTEVLVEAIGPKDAWSMINFGVKDDWGTALEFAGGGGEDRKIDPQTGLESMTHRLLFGPLGPVNTKPEYLVLQPKLAIPVREEDHFQKEFVSELKGEYPLEFDGGWLGSLKVVGTEFQKDKTVLTYQVSNLDHQYSLLFIEDAKGADVFPSKMPVRVKKEPYEFQMEFPPLNPEESLKLHLIFDGYRKQEKSPEIKIPLGW